MKPFPCLLLVGLAACASHPPPPTAQTPLLEGLRELGQVAFHPGTGDRVVVFIKDRHAIHGAITRTRGPLRAVQRENNAAVRFLMQKGFTLMGSESPLGPLPETPLAEIHRKRVRQALEEGDDLSSLTLYQPIRYEVQYQGRLTVLGIEDPALYGSDTHSLEQLVKLNGLMRRHDVAPEKRRPLAEERIRLISLVDSHVEARGRLAAANLLDTMQRLHRQRAILLLGGAHSRGIQTEFQKRQIPYVVFECQNYSRGLL